MQSMSELAHIGNIAYQRSDKCSSELLVLTYGVLVTQLMKDYEDISDVNREIENIGYNIGARLIDELLSKAELETTCSSFKEAVEVVAKVGFKMFLGVNVDLVDWNKDVSEVTMCLGSNPLAEFVEIPDKMEDTLKYSNIYCGAIRGSLEQVRLNVKCNILKDKNSNNLKEKHCIRVKLVL